MGVELEQLQVPQQQRGHDDLLGARDLCELAKVSDISIASRVLCILPLPSTPFFSRRSRLLGKNFPRLFPLSVVKFTASWLASEEFAESKVGPPRASKHIFFFSLDYIPAKIISKLNTAREDRRKEE